MSKRSSSSNNNTSSIVEQLSLLRNFVSSTNYSESDLTDCLKHCAYNVELAAEQLLTGQWKKVSSSLSTKKARGGTAFFRTVSSSDYYDYDNTSTSNNIKKVRYATSNHHQQRPPIPTSERKKPPPSSSSDGYDNNRRHSLPSNIGSYSSNNNEENNKKRPIVCIDIDDDSNDKWTTNDRTDYPSNTKYTKNLIDTISTSPTSDIVRSINYTTATTPSTTERTLPIPVSTTPSQKVAVAKATASTTSVVKNLLLCQRWIPDGDCITRNGRIGYNEEVVLEHSQSGYAFVRFRARYCEGKLPDQLATILTPLLRHSSTKLLDIKIKSLMEQSNMNTGTEIPLSITIIIIDPIYFFDLIQSSSTDTTNTNATISKSREYFEQKNGTTNATDVGSGKRSKTVLPVSKAAFLLLQWAQYGPNNIPNFNVTTTTTRTDEHTKVTIDTDRNTTSNTNEIGDNDDKDDEADDEGGVELSENDFEELSVAESTKEGKELFDQSTNDASITLPEANDPIGLADGITLRPYQKQALYFMYHQREQIGSSRDQLDEQLQLLSELASEKNKNTTSSKQIVEPTTNHFYMNHNSYTKKQPAILCDCSPVIVSDEAQKDALTIVDNQINPINHPLWERRYLASSDMKTPYIFYVNELMNTATIYPPEPPQPCSGGILADAMGLGKTVMLMSLILQSKYDREQTKTKSTTSTKEPKTTLVVAKLSLLPQWEDELRTKTNLSYMIFYGTTIPKQEDIVNTDVVVTTYGMIQGDLKRKNPILLSHTWLRVILDEAHCIRNHRTLASKACCALQAKHRWCVSGTIIQNSLEDVYGIMKFLKHEPWCIPSFWKAAITQALTAATAEAAGTSSTAEAPTNTSDNQQQQQHETTRQQSSIQMALSRVRRVLAPIMLRRTKDSLNSDGQPILVLPPIDLKVIQVNFNESEREFYNALLSRSLEVFDGFMAANSSNGKTAGNAYLQIFSLLQRLRQACDHIALTVKSNMENDDWMKGQRNDDTKGSGKPAQAKEVKSEEDRLGKAFMNDLLAKFYANYNSPQGKTIKDEDDDDEDDDSCGGQERSKSRPGPSSHKKYMANAAKILQQAVQSGKLNDECPICLDIPSIEKAVITPCAHTFCQSCLIGIFRDATSKDKSNETTSNASKSTVPGSFVIPDGECPVCLKTVRSCGLIIFTRNEETNQMTTSFLTKSRPNNTINSNQSSGTAAKPTTLFQDDIVRETREGNPIASARNILEQAINESRSSKIEAVMTELQTVWRQDPGSKVLIFSHYLGFLDLLGSELKNENIPVYRLDGSLSIKERMNVLDQFRSSFSSIPLSAPSLGKNDPTYKKGMVLLMSMGAGGEGLNITSASTCFIVEPWWNSAKEDQCVNRIHRIGQLADTVRVRKFIVRDSVEERIVELQQRKSYVAGEVYSDTNDDDDMSNPFGNAKLTMDDLRLIFRR